MPKKDKEMKRLKKENKGIEKMVKRN